MKRKLIPLWCFYIGLLVFSLWIIGFGTFCLYAFSFKFQPAEKTDAIVVLTGGGERVQTALRLLSDGYADHLLISGVHKTVRPAELVGALPPDLIGKVTLGYVATDTRGNARETAAFVRKYNMHRILLVTSFYHMPRSVFEILSESPDLQITALPVFPSSFGTSVDWVRTRYAWLLFSEYHKFIITHLHHFIERIFS